MPRIVTERADILPALAELFREHGFEGASLSLISERTGLGKGSLYHFFPGGKEEMAAAVIAQIDEWFEARVFRPLREETDARKGVERMLAAVEEYFDSGRRVCLIGAFALCDARDRFAAPIREYFLAWRDALADALARGGRTPREARDLAEESLGIIQGALVLARAFDDPAAFRRALSRLRTALRAR